MTDWRPIEAEPTLSPSRVLEAVQALARLSRQLERVSGELSIAQYRVLSAIAAGDQQASRLAAKLALGKPTISASVDALCRRGLAQRSAVEGDHRALALDITAAGRQTLIRVESAMVAKLGELTAATPNGLAVIDALTALGAVMDAAKTDADGRRR